MYIFRVESDWYHNGNGLLRHMTSGVLKGRRARHLPRGPPLR